MAETGIVRIAASADVHCKKTAPLSIEPWLAQAVEQADVLLICGDLTDNGLPEEAHILARVLSNARIPIVAVLGNHDFHAGKEEEIQKIVADAGVRVLSGDSCTVRGVGFAGVKGFAGGFGRRILEPWGEDTLKQFVHAGVEEALKLESALAKLGTVPRVAVLHYAPIQETVAGEPLEIYPFLGCSRLEEPLNRYAVAMAFHGHAHHGSPEGRTHAGIPVYNVSLPLLRRTFPDQPPFRLVEVAVENAEG
jgi:Icc-related predicted phosphoesterase